MTDTDSPDRTPTAEAVDSLLRRLFPICRSLSGDGNRQTFEILREITDFELRSVPSGTPVFDWTVPPEWRIRDAFVENARGERIIDFQASNLSVLNYSAPVDATVDEAELRAHLHTLPSHPDWIPYRTAYYKRNWGFCAPHALLSSDAFAGPFRVFIDSEFVEDGELLYAEATHKGRSDEEILISTYCCHPSLANDNLSGLLTAVLLFDHIRRRETRYSYRLVIVPETIGAISFLATAAGIENIVAGAVVTTTAGPGPFGLKPSFHENHWIDRIADDVLERHCEEHVRYPFVPDGSDERQYSSPRFRIPTVTLCKSKYYEYPQYHTSADDLGFISSTDLLRTLELYKHWFDGVERYCLPRRVMDAGEYQLGKRDLLPGVGGSVKQSSHEENKPGAHRRIFSLKETMSGQHLDGFFWLMHLADGTHSNHEIAARSGLDLKVIDECIELFRDSGLLED